MTTTHEHDDLFRRSPEIETVSRESEPSPPTEGTLDLLHMLQNVTSAIRKRWDQALRKGIPGMSAARASAILELARARRGVMSQVELARRVGVSQMTVTRLLDGLEKEGWVVRVPSATDRRVHGLGLTLKGHTVLTAIDSSSREFFRGNLGGVDAKAAVALTVALESLR